MKIWRITTTIHTENDFNEKEVINKIEDDLNRGDGVWLNTNPRQLKLKLIRKVKDDE